MITAASPAAVERVMQRIAEHVRAELTSDAPTITGTIAGDPFFPVLVRSDHGLELLLLTDTDAVEAFYAARVQTFEILDTNRVTELRSDWYALHESVAAVRHVGVFNGVEPTNAIHRVHSVVLFPTDAGGIVGELEWTRFDFADIFRGMAALPAPTSGPEAYLPLGRLAAADRHERMVRAWWNADAEAVAAELGEDCRWATRHAHADLPVPAITSGVDAAEIRAAVGQFASVELVELTRLQRVAADWFSFAEWKVVVTVGGSRRVARLVSLAPVDADGRLLGHLAYSVDAGESTD